jgi:hypothetical protein
MTNLKLKSALIAASVAFALLAPAAQAQAAKVSAPAPTAGDLIAAQGNAALRTIRAEVKAAIKVVKPKQPARVGKVSAPVPAAGSAPATAALAE